MADEWSQQLFQASYGGVEFDLVNFDDDVSRATADFEYPNRDGGYVEDDGASIRSTSCVIIFSSGLREGHIDAFVAFLNLLHDGEAHRFVHPITGSYEARPGGIAFSADADNRDLIVLNVTFREHEPDPAVFEAGSLEPVVAGVADVAAAVTDLDGELAAQGLSSSVGSSASSLSSTWDDGAGTLSQREINMELNRLANQIDAEIIRLELASDVRRQPTFQAMQRLRGSLRRQADRVIASGPKIVRYTVLATGSILVVAQEIYGGEGAETRARQIMDLNDIPDPTRILGGTSLLVQAPDDRLPLGDR